MEPRQVLPSTTSHKCEPLIATLDLFSSLGFRDIDLNLRPLIEGGVPADDVRAALQARRQRALILSGGWCDFFEPARIDETFRSVARQVEIAHLFGADRLRLFFGRLPRDRYSRETLAPLADNLRRLSDEHPDVLFVFENHDGASLDPRVCREAVETVARPNIRINFDPINFERAGVPSAEALRELQPLVGHVHLKGLNKGEYCEFGAGDVDLLPTLRSLIADGYRGGFSVEYEGPLDRTLGLCEGFRRAQAAIDAILSGS